MKPIHCLLIIPKSSFDIEPLICYAPLRPMSSLQRQDTLYGFDTSQTTGLNHVSTISGLLSTLNLNANINNGDTSTQGRVLPITKSDQSDEVDPNPLPESNHVIDRGFSIRRALTRRRKSHTSKKRCYMCGASTIHRKKDIKLRKLLALIAVFIVYVSLGAVVFESLESGPAADRKESFEIYIDKFLERNPCVSRSEVFDLIKEAVVDTELVFYVLQNKTHLDRWDFSGSFGFVVSVVTTIGFGNLSPFTLEGKGVCVVYAIFGIPLTLLVLSGIGQKMAHYFTKIRRIRYALCNQTPSMNKRINVLIIAALGVIIIFLVPAGIFSYVENWHYLEALYFCFTTLSTVGFGDYIIGLHEDRLTHYTHQVYVIAGYIWILLGLAYLSLIYRIAMDTVVASARRMEQRTKQRLGPEYGSRFGESSRNAGKSRTNKENGTKKGKENTTSKISDVGAVPSKHEDISIEVTDETTVNKDADQEINER